MKILSTYIPTTLVILMVSVSGLLYFSGCVVVPKQAVVVSGPQDQAVHRQAVTCSPELEFLSAEQDEDGIDPDGFSLLSWNAHRGTHQDWSRDLVSFGSSADIILLQEAAVRPIQEAQIDLFANQWLMATAFQLEERDIGILSATRVSPEAYCVSREPEPLFNIPKIGLAAAYPLTGTDTRLLVVNIHLVNFTFTIDAVGRQFDSLNNIIMNHDGPVIIAGDFNTWNDSREVLVQQRMSELDMTPVTFYPDNRVTFFNRRVDGIYYRGLEVTKSLSHQVESSDHNPIEVHFRLSGPTHG